MKRQLNQLIAEIETKIGSPRRSSLKCKDVHKFTNKILVDAVEYNRPTSAQKYVKEEMKGYPIPRSLNKPRTCEKK